MSLTIDPPVRVVPLRGTVWALRTLVLVVIALLCVIAGSGSPAFAFALNWFPTVLFVVAYLNGTLHFPSSLVRVHALEPALYRWLGVGLVKRLVATRLWPVLVGVVPPPMPTNRHEFLDRLEDSTKGAEICHWGTFLLALSVAIFCAAVGRIHTALWIVAFNVLLNGYPIMLQRSNRWRLHPLRAKAHGTRGSR